MADSSSPKADSNPSARTITFSMLSRLGDDGSLVSANTFREPTSRPICHERKRPVPIQPLALVLATKRQQAGLAGGVTPVPTMEDLHRALERERNVVAKRRDVSVVAVGHVVEEHGLAHAAVLGPRLAHRYAHLVLLDSQRTRGPAHPPWYRRIQCSSRVCPRITQARRRHPPYRSRGRRTASRRRTRW